MQVEQIIAWIRKLEGMRDGTAQTDRAVDDKLADLLNDPDAFARFNHWMEPATANSIQSPRPEPGMTVDDALLAMGAIEAQRSRIGDRAADMLTAALLGHPPEFWDVFFSAFNPPSAETAELFLQLGPDGTFNDLRAAMSEQHKI